MGITTPELKAWVYANVSLQAAVEAVLQANAVRFNRYAASGSQGASEYEIFIDNSRFEDLQKDLSGLAFLTRTRQPFNAAPSGDPQFSAVPVAGAVYVIAVARQIGVLAGTTSLVIPAGARIVFISASASQTCPTGAGQLLGSTRVGDITIAAARGQTAETTGTATANILKTPFLVPAGGYSIDIVTASTAVGGERGYGVVTVIYY